MLEVKEGDSVVYNSIPCHVKRVCGKKCTVEFDAPYKGSMLKIVKISDLTQKGESGFDFKP